MSEVIRYLIERQPDMLVVSEVLDPVALLQVIKTTKADVVIVTPLAANGEPHICCQLLAKYPLLIIATQPEGEAAHLYQSDMPKQRINEPPELSIVDAVRPAMLKIIS